MFAPRGLPVLPFTFVFYTAIMYSSLSTKSLHNWYCRRHATSPRTLIMAAQRPAWSLIAIQENRPCGLYLGSRRLDWRDAEITFVIPTSRRTGRSRGKGHTLTVAACTHVCRSRECSTYDKGASSCQKSPWKATRLGSSFRGHRRHPPAISSRSAHIKRIMPRLCVRRQPILQCRLGRRLPPWNPRSFQPLPDF